MFVLPDGVACPQPDPLWNWPVLLLRFGKLLLRPEGLVRLHHIISVTVTYPSVVTYRHLDCCRRCLLEMWEILVACLMLMAQIRESALQIDGPCTAKIMIT